MSDSNSSTSPATVTTNPSRLRFTRAPHTRLITAFHQLEAAIRELSESFYTALQQTASSETVSATGTVRQNKKVVHALNRLSESMIVVQDELNLQKNLAKLAEMKAKEGKKRRSKLYYGNKDGGEMDHVTQRFFALRSILTFISCIPPAALVFGGAILIEDKRYYRLAVAFWPIEALFVLLHFIITIERSTREPNPEEKVRLDEERSDDCVLHSAITNHPSRAARFDHALPLVASLLTPLFASLIADPLCGPLCLPLGCYNFLPCPQPWNDGTLASDTPRLPDVNTHVLSPQASSCSRAAVSRAQGEQRGIRRRSLHPFVGRLGAAVVPVV